jgi:hypothetical protein
MKNATLVVVLGCLLVGACATPVEEAETQEREEAVTSTDEADQTVEAEDADRTPRGLECRRTCEDRFAEDMRDCAKLPAGFWRKGCEDRSLWMHRMCLRFCQKGPRDCLDGRWSGAMSLEWANQSQSES